MNFPSSLEQTAAEFDAWRQNRGSGSIAFPVHLRKKAVSLLANYTKNQVVKALKLNHAMLKQWQQPYGKDQSPQFVSLNDVTSGHQDAAVQIHLSHPNGTQMQFNGTFTGNQLRELVVAFMSLAGESL